MPLPRSRGIIPNSYFLAGSIEMDTARNWQKEMESDILSISKPNTIVFNPRRDNWDSSWKQTIDDPNFNEQVNWELDALEMSETIIVYFDENTKSPITLLEVGLFAKSGRLLICCPKKFWRRGNIEILAHRERIFLCSEMYQLRAELLHRKPK